MGEWEGEWEEEEECVVRAKATALVCDRVRGAASRSRLIRPDESAGVGRWRESKWLAHVRAAAASSASTPVYVSLPSPLSFACWYGEITDPRRFPCLLTTLLRPSAQEKERLAQQQADAAAEVEKLKAANKKLEGDLSDARKEASAQADATSDVEKKLKEVRRALAWAAVCARVARRGGEGS